MTVLFCYTALGLPLAWKKFSGGPVCRWVGFELFFCLNSSSKSQTIIAAADICNGVFPRLRVAERLVTLLLNFMKQTWGNTSTRKQSFCADARVQGDEIYVGGWALDSPDLCKCRWLSERTSHQSGRWLYLAGELYRPIAALEPCHAGRHDRFRCACK